jgi:N-acetylmuramoyl-L-alanine amidase
MAIDFPFARRDSRVFAAATLALPLFLFTSTDAWPASSTRFTTVVIDAGHGGFDRGGIPGQRVAEKAVALDVAQRLQRALAQQGYRTVMTRDEDVFVPLPQRVAIANSYRNAIFVCIHFNAAGRSGANGIETYFYSSESAPLAASIHRNLAAGAPTENRGLRRRGYYVLRKTRIPAVLVECGFLTNPLEAELAQTAGYRQKLANEIANGIRGQPALAERRTSSGRISLRSEGEKPSLYRADTNGTSVLDMADAEAAVKPHLRSGKKKSSSTTRKKSSSKKSAHSSSQKKSSKTSAKKKSLSSETKKEEPTQPNE